MTRDTQPRVTIAMLGARRRYAVPRILARAGWLELFYTDLFGHGSWREFLLRRGLDPTDEDLRKLLERSAADLPSARVRQFPAFGLFRLARSRLARNHAARLHAYLRWNRAFCRRVVRRGLGDGNAVYVFNAAGLEILRAARENGMRTFVDQITAPWSVEESLLQEERRLWPGWEQGGATETDWRPLADREQEEWALADRILCGSDFVRDGVRASGGPVERCRTVPYGTNAAAPEAVARKPDGGPLRVLFVGALQLRKGVQYLLEAARALAPGTAQFRAAGPVQLAPDAARALASRVELAGALSRDSLAREYAWADVLALPSISEGSANVCYEALANGIPVIATPNSGSVVRDGEEGFIVPIRDPHAIEERLRRLADDRSLLARLSDNARQRGAEFTVEAYEARLTEAIRDTFRT